MNRRTIIFATLILWFAGAGFAATAAGLAKSASKVDVDATVVDQAAGEHSRTIRVVLNTADGWHVNAHPASLDFLVATTVHARVGQQNVPLAVAYPDGRDSNIQLGDTTIQIYGDGTVIPVHFTSETMDTVRGAGQLTLDIRVQACSNDGVCLPPSRISTSLDRA